MTIITQENQNITYILKWFRDFSFDDNSIRWKDCKKTFKSRDFNVYIINKCCKSIYKNSYKGGEKKHLFVTVILVTSYIAESFHSQLPAQAL